jgi:hypothetical protein
MAATTRAKGTDAADAEQLHAELDGLRAALQTVARVTAQTAASGARGQWTDFGKLLSGQYSIAPADVELFLAILRGDKP